MKDLDTRVHTSDMGSALIELILLSQRRTMIKQPHKILTQYETSMVTFLRLGVKLIAPIFALQQSFSVCPFLFVFSALSLVPTMI